MTTVQTGRGPAYGHPALSRLVNLDPEKFADTVWGREPLLSPAASLPASFEDLFSEDAVDELVSSRGLRTPFLRVAKDGKTLPAAAFTAAGGAGAGVADQVSDDKLLRLFDDGATIVLQALHRTWPPLAVFAQQLAAELGHPVQVNSYTTPPQHQGFSDHYDVHDVFVLQVCGEKTWRIRAPVHPVPLRDQPWERRRLDVAQAALREPLIEATLRPGDCLYLPRGYLHSATASGGGSTHLTIGVHVWTTHAVAEQLATQALAALADRQDAREALPLGIDVTDPAQLGTALAAAREALLGALDALTADQLAARMRTRSRDSQRPAPIRPLAQLRAAERLTPQDSIAIRPYAAAHLEAAGDGWRVVSRVGQLALDAADLPAVAAFLADGHARVATTGMELARLLLRSGLAVLGRPDVTSSGA
ncbi:MAG TPA: cupin domain-containing protein [Dermatophilaceae bacterium]|nr:cupin domain-containing protein [Dermatophilaceae bacterium]